MRYKITSAFISAESYYNLISIHLCFKQTSNKYLLKAKHCSKCWEYSGEGNRQNSLLCEAYSLARKSEEQNKQLKYMLTSVKEWYKLREEKRGTLLLSVKSDWESHWAGQELKEMTGSHVDISGRVLGRRQQQVHTSGTEKRQQGGWRGWSTGARWRWAEVKSERPQRRPVGPTGPYRPLQRTVMFSLGEMGRHWGFMKTSNKSLWLLWPV